MTKLTDFEARVNSEYGKISALIALHPKTTLGAAIVAIIGAFILGVKVG